MQLLKQILLFADSAPDLERAIADISTQTVWIATVTLVGLVVIGAIVKKHAPRLKLPVFIGISITTIVTTFMLAGLTVYLNVTSVSGGPVHWHADFQVWACGEKLELRDPQGTLTNKIGTASYHEHNDERIHLEGVVVQTHDASLGKFFNVVGGEISESKLVVPLNDGKVATFEDGEACPDGTVGDVQVYVYSVQPEKINGKSTYSQQKLDNPQDHIIAPHANVPPGDCVIIEFGPTADRTEHKCLQYEVQDEELDNYREVL